MQYRQFGKCDFKVSALGFGCMRLPIIDGDEGKINEPEAIKLIRHAIDNGVNYIDTAYPYHKGMSEIATGKALLDGYRDKVKLATKLPSWLINSYEDFDKYLNEQLDKLQTDHIDCYLLHSLSKRTWDKIRDLGVMKFVKGALEDGRIKQIGFSFHDKLETFKEIVDYYDWDFCQIQYNFMDENYQAGTEGLKYAVAKGMAVIVMEPLRGGKLVKNPPSEVLDLWNTADIKRTPPAWALKWIWNNPEVSTILSGMGKMNEVVENIEIAEDSYPNSLTAKELELVNLVKEKYRSFTKIGCTACSYCMPCPEGVNIPQNFGLYNEAFMYNTVEPSKMAYERFMTEKSRASACKECGLCEDACPQNLPIKAHLKEVHSLLTK
jgi:predicted aldo/keto reductase-like oxidoreductase